MATIAAIAPTPQQSFAHMQPAVSPQGPSAQPTGMPGYYGHNYNMSFDSQHGPLPYPPPNQHPHPHQHQPQNGQPVYAQSFASGPVSNPGYARSFGEGYGPVRGYMEKAQIYTVRNAETTFGTYAILILSAGRLLRRLCLRNGYPGRSLHAPAQ